MNCFIKYLRIVHVCGLLVLSTSCGYSLGQGDITAGYSTITIPYVDGDEYGEFTAELVKQISVSGPLRYDRCDGELTLIVSIIDYDYDNIGFRYDRKNVKKKKSEEQSISSDEEDKEKKRSKSIIPCETRVEGIAEVSLIETASGRVILGPAKITASLDFDHEYYDSWNEINQTSLGQLTDYDAAVDGSFKPLFQILAHKISDYIYEAW
jgi:hypothetical protein